MAPVGKIVQLHHSICLLVLKLKQITKLDRNRCTYKPGKLSNFFSSFSFLLCVVRFFLIFANSFISYLTVALHPYFGVKFSKTNAEKITNEMLAGLSENSSDSESLDVESGNEDVEDRPWRSSHVVFGRSTVKQGQIEAMKGSYFRDISIVRARGENIIPLPEANGVVVLRSFMKDGLRFSLHKMLVDVLKTFQIYLHQITHEALIRVGGFIWAMRSQRLEPDARCFCNIHELSYQTRATGKEQYHNNFGCYSFVPRSEASYPMPTFRKRWPSSWMQEWFYVKNDLSQREDVKGIIQHPIWSRFGLRRPLIALGNDVQACQAAFNTVCIYIGTRDLV
jgi:hypothetical protein